MSVRLLSNVSIADQVKVSVFKGMPTPQDRNPVVVSVDSLDPEKRVVFDEKALAELNNKLTEKMKAENINNPNAFQYLEEFVTKMVEELRPPRSCNP
jgi:hypothetical protein